MKNTLTTIILIAAVSALCVELHLPLKDEHKHLFEEIVVNVEKPESLDHFGVCKSDIYYKSITEEPITKVFYNNFELYEDTNEPVPNRKLIVSYAEYQGRVFIRVFYRFSIYKFEGAFYIINDHVYDLLKIANLMSRNDNLINGETPGKFVTSMFFKLGTPNKLNPGDNSPRPANYVPRQGDPISIYEIEHEINNIYRMKFFRKPDFSKRKRNKSK